MIYFQRDTASEVILTLKEKQTIANPYYLFEFKHRSTNQIVTFILSWEEDESLDKSRYNQFTILTNVRFVDAPDGEYIYNIYQLTNDVIVGNPPLLETGIARVFTENNFEFTTHETNNTFITR